MDDLVLCCNECGEELEVEVYDCDTYDDIHFISLTYTPCLGPKCQELQ